VLLRAIAQSAIPGRYLDVTLSRAAQREGRQLREVEPIVGLYGAFENLGALEGHVIDSSDQHVEQTTSEVAAGLRTGRFTVGS
jgi:hypothetical protein